MHFLTFFGRLQHTNRTVGHPVHASSDQISHSISYKLLARNLTTYRSVVSRATYAVPTASNALVSTVSLE